MKLLKSKRADLTNIRFGKLVAIEPFDNKKWVCKCDCGNQKIVWSTNLKQGYSKSCGCVSSERLKKQSFRHGFWVDKKYRSEYSSWLSAKGRCTNPDNEAYPDYGGRGIKMCDRWLNSFENFLSDMGRKPTKNHSLDRFPNMNGNYEPSNCRWATVIQQNRNRRSNVWFEYKGDKKTLAEWAIFFKVTGGAVRWMLNKKGNFEDVFIHYLNKNK